MSLKLWWVSQVTQTVESVCNAGDPVSIPGQGNSLEKSMAMYFGILAWRITWTEETCGLQSMGW